MTEHPECIVTLPTVCTCENVNKYVWPWLINKQISDWDGNSYNLMYD